MRHVSFLFILTTFSSAAFGATWYVENSETGAGFGGSVSALSDVNGDGVADLAVGAPSEDGPGVVDSGRVHILDGATGNLLSVLDSPNPETAGFFGGSVARVADMTGDGIDDLVVGACQEDGGGMADAGRAYLYDPATGQLLRTIESPSPELGGRFGYSVAGLEDVTGDGLGDVLIGAPDEDGGGLADAGRAYVFSGATGTLLHTLTSPSAEAGGGFGTSLAETADLTADGISDVLIGAPYEDGAALTDAGRAHLFDGSNGSWVRTLESPNPEVGGAFGLSLSDVPDLNNTGVDDLVVGAPDEDGAGVSDSGRVYVFEDVTGALIHTLVSQNAEVGGAFGSSVFGIADMNADTLGEVIVGARAEDAGGVADSGQVYILDGVDGHALRAVSSTHKGANGFFGSSVSFSPDTDDDGVAVMLVGAPGGAQAHAMEFTLRSPIELPSQTLEPESGFGRAVSAVPDVNGDGVADLVVGAWHANYGAGDPNVDGTGRAYVFDGLSGRLFRTLNSPNEEPGAAFGMCVAGITDLDGDGRGDIIVTAVGEDAGGVTDSGRVYIFSGATGAILHLLESPNPEHGGLFGGWLAVPVPDTNGDGVCDVVVGALWEDVGAFTNAGRAYVFDGATGALLQTLESPNPPADGGAFGHGAAGLGDINGDGLGDVAVSEVVTFEGLAHPLDGRVHVFDGATGEYIRLLDEQDGFFGAPVEPGPDIDGDGSPEILVGAPLQDHGGVYAAGQVYVYSGASGQLLNVFGSHSPATSAGFGLCLAVTSDLNADGLPDLLVSAYEEDASGVGDSGCVYTFDAATGDPLLTISSPNPAERGLFGEGRLLAVPGLNADGSVAVIVGAQGEEVNGVPDAGRAYVFTKLEVAEMLDGGEFVSTNPQVNGGFGGSVSTISDVNGDGIADILVGGDGEDASGLTDSGRVYILDGDSGEILFSRESLYAEAGGAFGAAVATVPDLSGDGVDDLVVGAYQEDGASVTDSGRAYVYDGVVGGLIHVLESPLPETSGHFGYSVCGLDDVTGDGLGDLLIGAPDEDGAALTDAGRAYVFDGVTGSRLHTLESPNAEAVGRFGVALAGITDVTSDSVNDMLVGASYEDAGGFADSGRAYVFSGATGGWVRTLGPPNPEVGGGFGVSLSGVPDLDNTGVDDLVIGAPYEDGAGFVDSGRTYVFEGGSGTLIHTLVSQNAEVGGEFGASVFGVADWNGDARGEVIVGARHEDVGAIADCGRVHIFDGGTGTPLRGLASTNRQPGGGFGSSVSGLPHPDGGSLGLVIVGAPGEDAAGLPGAGRVYVLTVNTDNPIEFTSPDPEIAGGFGYSTWGLEDVTGDGSGDLLVGACLEDFESFLNAGAIYVFGGVSSNLVRTLRSPNIQHHGGFGMRATNVPDLNGDALDEIIAGTWGEGMRTGGEGAGLVYVFDGATGSVIHELASPDPMADIHIGDPVGSINDLNGDGLAELLVGSYDPMTPGRVHIYDGATGNLFRTVDSPNPVIGAAFVLGTEIPDLTGDGVNDLAVGTPSEMGGQAFVGGTGRVYVYDGVTGDLLYFVESPEPEVDGQFGCWVAGVPDLNGDGLGDIVVTARLEDGRNVVDSGRAYIYDGVTGALIRTLTSPHPQVGGEFGKYTACGVSDLNGDGLGEVVIGASMEDVDGVADVGRAYVFDGATGDRLLTLVSPNPTPGGWFGNNVIAVPDMDGDGLPEIAVTASTEEVDGIPWAGRAYVFMKLLTDSDGDGIPDWWERMNGLDPADPGDAAADVDGDGLTYAEEFALDTDFTNPDSDLDGLSDYDEAVTYTTDPNAPDSDGDALNDYEELFTYETDPSNPDSDGDGLTDGDEVHVYGTDPMNPDITSMLEATFEVNTLVRPGEHVVWLEYKNVGNLDMAAPLLIVSSPQNVPMRLSQNEPFRTGPVHVLGLNTDDPVDVLGPGDGNRIPIYFLAQNPGTIDFNLDNMIVDKTPIDWSAVEVDVRPADVDPQVWERLWPLLTDQIGDTWQDYHEVLIQDVQYLDTLGRSTHNVRDIFSFEVRKALSMNPRRYLAGSLDAFCPAPGLSLVFARSFRNGLDKRLPQGPLGRGWTHTFDIYIEEHPNGSVSLHDGSGFVRMFWSTGGGVYSPSLGDHGELVKSGGIYTLTEKDGSGYQFRADLKLDYIDDLNGNRITAAYDVDGHLIAVSHSSGDGFQLAYNGDRITQLTDHAGRVTTYEYDATGEHLEHVAAPGARVTSYSYTPETGAPGDHALVSIAYPDGTHQYYEYDVLGRLSREYQDGNAERLVYAYEEFGNVLVEDAEGGIITILPDEYGRPGQVEDALGQTINMAYDPRFNLSQITNPAAGTYSFEYDELGNVIGTEDALGNILGLSYDYRFNALALLQDARGNETEFGYDASGNLTDITYPDTSAETFGYCAAGNLIAASNRRGDTIQYTYNARGQVTREDYPDGSYVTYAYDAAGRMTQATDASGATSLAYDDRGFLTYIEYPSGHWFTFEYNDAGQRTRRVGDDGYQLDYYYDAAGRLEGLTDGDGTELVLYEYDDTGRLSAEYKGNGTYTTYTYDIAGQLLSMVNRAPDSTVQSRFDYTYGANGNRTSMTRLDGTTSYDYDAIGQLVGVTYPDASWTTYEYDAAGNRIAVTENGVPTAYATNNMNQYTQVGTATYTYDADGNMTSKTDAEGTTTYEYDYENRLIGVTAPTGDTWQYVYDALGNRVASIHNGVETGYVHDPVGLVDVAAEYDSTGGLVARYVHGLGLLARIDSVTAPAYYAFDAIGSTSELTDAIGTVVNSYTYDPFGVSLSQSETVPNPFQYVGKYGVMDEAGGLQLMRARFYDQEAGRFISEEPVEFYGSSNLYKYASNDPVSLIDPEGLAFLVPMGQQHLKAQVKRICQGLLRDAQRYAPRSWTRKELLRSVTAVVFEIVMLRIPAYPVPNPFLVGIPAERSETLGEASTDVVVAIDPNEKVGPPGEGAGNYVGVDDDFTYTIHFENLPAATAPALEVFIVDYLDPSLDWATFQLQEFAFGEHVIAVPGHTDHHAERVTATVTFASTDTLYVDMEGSIDHGMGTATWTFTCLDPATGEFPENPLVGFLPPEDGSGRGQGYVTFSIRPKPDCAPGTVIANHASIVFDTSPAIDTNVVMNTIAELPPGVPALPSPGNGAVRVPKQTALNWSDCNHAAFYDVYLGTSPTPPLYAQDVDASYLLLALGSLDNGTVYYWKVVAKNNTGGATEGPLWTFTTKTVFEQWIDGYDDLRTDQRNPDGDPDCDGLTNQQEYSLRTRPDARDSDGDGASDGREVAAGTDPLDPNDHPPLVAAITYEGDLLVSTQGDPTANVTLKAVLRDESGNVVDADGELVTFTLTAEGVGTVTVSALSEVGVASTVKALVPGVYIIEVMETGSGVTATAVLAVYNPDGGFATGGGWIVPQDDGLNTHANARANFGFVAKYKRGLPTGHVEFRYSDGYVDLKSTSIEQLVITGGRIAQFKGWACVNGEHDNWFFVKAIDNGEPGVGVDTFEIKIWAPDVEPEGDPTERAAGVLQGGNIVVHTRK